MRPMKLPKKGRHTAGVAATVALYGRLLRASGPKVLALSRRITARLEGFSPAEQTSYYEAIITLRSNAHMQAKPKARSKAPKRKAA